MIDQFKDKKVLVIGDIIIDEYVYGDVTRISAEAPIPVFKYVSHEYRPGGAANVAANIQTLGGTPILIGLAGMYHMDSVTDSWIKRFPDCTVIPSYRTQTIKTRYISQGHQMLRVDKEITDDIEEALERKIVNAINERTADAIVISDYAKGVVTEEIYDAAFNQAHDLNIPIIVAPKPKNIKKFNYATIYCVNESEFNEIAEKHPLSLLDSKYLIVTKGKNGADLYIESTPEHHEAIEVSVADTTGAGDTFLAAFTLAYLASGNASKAVNVAITAAGIAVTKFGTATVTAEELKEELE